ncbi:hypothetical protein Cgig2_022592 [Carnegiea gigantea]|uniref:Uncharacterized protein n=1 Tax=Carnegiea gigantea TaxID=171969 RepID=A0A9Q1KKU6_9CARY|nr:hypothetical protein Cgig2_022592 [Carnegiea gigantea]
MTDTITRQVLEQVERAMEAAKSARPLPHFDYVPTNRGELSRRPERVPSPRYTEQKREVSRLNWSERPYTEQQGRRAAARPNGRPSGHTTTECRELKKALHEFTDKGQIDRFLKKGPRFFRREPEPVLTTEQRPHITVPTMVFGGKKAPRYASPHNDPLVVEMKIASGLGLRPWPTSTRLRSGAPLLPGRQPLQHSALHRGSQPPSKRFGHYHLLLSDLWGNPSCPRSQVPGLKDKGKLGHGISLDESGGWPLGARGRTVTGLRSGSHDLRGGVDRLPKCRVADRSAPAFPAWVGADVAVSSGRPSIHWRLWTGKLMAGFFSCGSKVYLLGLLVDEALPLLFPTVLGLGCHLLRSGVPGLNNCQPRPHLLYIKQKGNQERFPNLTLGTKRKSYFQYFTFDFFLMAVMNPGLLLKQYHPKSTVSLGALWMVCTRLNARAEHNLYGRQFVHVQNLFNHQVKRKSKTVVESQAINCYTFSGRLIHGCIRLEDYEGVPCRQEILLLKGRPLYDCWDHPAGLSRLGAPGNSGPFAIISGTSPISERPFLLIDAPSEDECLDELSEEEEEEVPPEVELVLVEATSAPGFDELRAEQGLPRVPSANNSSGNLMRGVDLVFAILRT